jgi:hypothetical protein
MTNTPKYFVRNGWNLTLDKAGPEVWLFNGPERTFVARFKYARAMACAKHFAKFITSAMSPAEYAERMEANRFPTGDRAKGMKSLEDLGYVHYNILYARKRGWIK